MKADVDGRGVDLLERVLGELQRLNAEARRDGDDLWEAIDDLHATLERRDGEPATSGRPTPSEYRRLRRRLRRLVEAVVPAGGVVAVVSRGDPDLLDLPDFETLHYPLAPGGHYLGFYPPDGTPAIAHLEWVRAGGAEYLLLPSTASWWLDSFPRLAAHLGRTATVVAEREGTGWIYDLRACAPGRDVAEEVERLAAAWERATGESPAILDWSSGLELAGRLPERTVFSPPSETRALPYLERTVDIVVTSDAPRSDEARRVAARSVVHPREGTGWNDGCTVDHVDEPPPHPPSASIVIPTYDGVRHLRPCFRALERTLGPHFVGEVIVVDDGSGSATVDFLAERATELPWLRVVRNATNLGFIGSCNRGAAEADGEILVFLNDDTVPLDGWLPALLQVFERRDDAGAVGGRLIYPDGRLQEAGGVIYRDGGGANVGRGDWNPDAPVFTYLRQVDYCSGALLATPRSLFRALGGFDTRYRPAYYEDTEYCFAVRDSGRAVYYQPASTVVHVEGATVGTDVASGVKRFQLRNQATFQRRWRETLRNRPDAPRTYDDRTWIELARGEVR